VPRRKHERYDDVAGPVISARPSISVLDLFFHTSVTRSRGLHEAVVRETRRSNPVAAFTLIRSWAELAATICYVTDRPDYIEVLTERKENLGRKGGRKSMQALIAHASARMPGLRAVYSELSETAHFGALAFWSAFRPGSDESREIQWTSYPQWRSDDEALLACAWAIELSEATFHLLSEFAARHLPPPEMDPE